jgi:TolB-like protein
LGKYLAEELTTKLFKSKKLKVVERQLINKVIAEQKLSLTEIIEASAAKKIGRILGVEAIVVGTISDLGKTLRINARIIGTETGEVFAAAATEVYKDESVCNLIKCTGVINSNNTESVIITEPVKKMESVKNDTKKIQPKRPQYKILTQQLGRYIYELLSCQITGSTVICELQITNNDYETYASFPAGGRTQISILYDQSGNESYLTKKGEFANGADQHFL